MHSRGSRHRSVRLQLAALLWAIGVCAGTYLLWRYAYEPGVIEAAPTNWPPASRIARPDGHPVLLMFVHPRCPCSRASLRELERLTARQAEHVESHVVFVGAANAGPEWFQTDLKRFASAMRGVNLFYDRQGDESVRFRAWTSGLVLLYSARGVLLFHGGITPGQAHEGDNAGTDALAATIRNQNSSVAQNPVFGCTLQLPDSLAFQD